MSEYGGCEIAPIFKNGVQNRRVWIYTQKRRGKIRAVTIAVVRKANKVLAVACHDPVKDEKFYRLQGGGIEFGETAAEALQREIKEEIGVEISVGKKLGVYENIFIFGNQKGHEIMILHEATLPSEYMQKDKIPMLEEEFKGRCYEFVEITADKRIYPAIFGDEEWQQYI
jgi:ADP-ribose pyrophosphatase YjhB (NUDIX family)